MTQLVTDYVEGRMPWSQRLHFQLHLGMCRSCRRYVQQMRLTIQATGALPAEPMPEEVRTALLSAFRLHTINPGEPTCHDPN